MRLVWGLGEEEGSRFERQKSSSGWGERERDRQTDIRQINRREIDRHRQGGERQADR